MINLYNILHINSHATKEEIQKAYFIQKHMANDRNTLWLIEEAYNLLIDDNKRSKYDELILKNNLAYTKPNDIKTDPTILKVEEKIPKLLSFIVWLFSIECGVILFKNLKSTVIFALSANHNAINILIIFVSVIGLFATLTPILLGVLAVHKRLKIAIIALMLVAMLHLVRNVISYLMFGIVVDSIALIALPIICICLLVIAMFNKDVKAWLNESIINKKGYIFLYFIFSVIYMIIFAIGLADMKKYVAQDTLIEGSEMKFLGATGEYYYYLDLSRKIMPISNGYIIPIVVTDTSIEQSQYKTNVIVDNQTQTYCMQNDTKDCKNQSSFNKYDLNSPVNEAMQYIANLKSNESN